MAHYVLNAPSGDAELAGSFLRAGLWGVSRDQRHADALASGDHALIHVAGMFIGRADIAGPVHGWTTSEAAAFPGESDGGVVLANVEQWASAVSMAAAVRRIDPTGTNPLVQANAAGFTGGLVLLTAVEYAAVLHLSRDAPGA
jgi:hypothetical protein